MNHLLRCACLPALAGCGSLAHYPVPEAVDPAGSTVPVDCSADPSACDADGDGEVAAALGGDDCDDADDKVHPGAREKCDDVDNDCDGDVDNGDEDLDGVDVCSDCDDEDEGRYPGAEELCDGFDSDCDDVDCDGWSDGFESGLVAAPWSMDGDAAWRAFDGLAQSGNWCAASGIIGNGQSTSIAASLDFPEGGEVSFWHTGSTEQSYDFLRFFVDGVEQGSWSGSWQWTHTTAQVAPGVHLFELRYEKDTTVASGEDGVLVDTVSAVGGQAAN